MTRVRLFQLRLLASGALLLLVFGVVRLLWYPGAYFSVFGAGTQFLVLAAVVIVAGPVLSAFVDKPGKKGLTFDLWVLAGVELLAVMVAGFLLFQRQPHFAVGKQVGQQVFDLLLPHGPAAAYSFPGVH